MGIAENLRNLGISIPSAPRPVATYVPFAVEGKLVFIAGQGTFGPDGKLKYVGKVGRDTRDHA